MRRRLARRAQPVRARPRRKNENRAVLMRCLKDRPPAADLFGVKGRRWLADQQLALCERETVDAGLRQVDFLDTEIAQVERLIAVDALGWPEVKRLMTVPGVNVIVAATFMAAVGDIRRFGDRRKLTAYLGLDPKVRQSGAGPANHGHISKQGSNSARHALVEACWSTVRQPGPIAAFYQRVRARRGHSIAIVASARKLACLFWCLLTRGEDYAFAQPSLTAKKMRRLELAAGAPRWQGGRHVWSTNDAMRQAERALAEQAELAYKPTSPTGKPPGRPRRARVRHRGTHIESPRRAKARGRPQPRTSALRFVSHPRPTPSLPPGKPRRRDHLTFSVRKSSGRAVVSGAAGRSSDRRRADPLTFCRPAGLTDGCCVARRRPRISGVT